MILISHRGNIHGPSKMENKPSFIISTLRLGYDAEIDVWFDNGWWLGHDNPQYKIDIEWIYKHRKNLWVHCKNRAALENLNEPKKYFPWVPKVNYLWHQNDDYTLTSAGFVWVYPGKEIIWKCVCVLPELSESPYETSRLRECHGICSDFIERYRDL